ncbi:MAG TPA: hypothetical protein VNZ84_00055, partial [Methylophilus sp.]|nr:hypothetical protein [Methylophilus sp.]
VVLWAAASSASAEFYAPVWCRLSRGGAPVSCVRKKGAGAGKNKEAVFTCMLKVHAGVASW